MNQIAAEGVEEEEAGGGAGDDDAVVAEDEPLEGGDGLRLDGGELRSDLERGIGGV